MYSQTINNISMMQVLIEQAGYILFTISLVSFYVLLIALIVKGKIFKR